eukprot:CAMPEP_0194422720 /NCGR_PEP_ID=MMETSP0176-20130528/22030_1 /TAXON_ID=216777 /ORGANISM="Proboscia alata, Strain PI-D3" /LENGTH=1206 /DNA_ID=CAMNT_0039231609 /DNA_START=304 /DNA_END=3924 /DNA_ORIENTATION=+
MQTYKGTTPAPPAGMIFMIAFALALNFMVTLAFRSTSFNYGRRGLGTIRKRTLSLSPFPKRNELNENISLFVSLNQPDLDDGDACVQSHKKKNGGHFTRRQFVASSSAVSASTVATSIGIASNPPGAEAADVFSAGWLENDLSTVVSASGTNIPQAAAVTSFIDPFPNRQYHLHTLPTNGLRSLLVYDTDPACVSFSAGNRKTTGPGIFGTRAPSSSSVSLCISKAGQFSDTIPGIAHLMEHLVCTGCFSSSSVGLDFDDWLCDNDTIDTGNFNAFTSQDYVCFHFLCGDDILPQALAKFAALFTPPPSGPRSRRIPQGILNREIGRVNDELLTQSDGDRSKEYSLLKYRCNRQHPFSIYSAGSYESLKTIPENQNLNIQESLSDFWDERYLAENSVLVVQTSGCSNVDWNKFEKLVAPFDNTFGSGVNSVESQKEKLTSMSAAVPSTSSDQNSMSASAIDSPNQQKDTKRKNDNVNKSQDKKKYSQPFPRSINPCLLLSSDKGAEEKLTIAWPFEFEYFGLNCDSNGVTIPMTLLGYIVNQMLGRSGPGSLYQYLVEQDWVVAGKKGIPQFNIPVNVDGFQILEMSFILTPLGLLHREQVLDAVYESIYALTDISQVMQQKLFKKKPASFPSVDKKYENFCIAREYITQYLTTASLHGFLNAPRCSDVIELSSDAVLYGLADDSFGGVVGASGLWSQLPFLPYEEVGIAQTQDALSKVLQRMNDRTSAIVTFSVPTKNLRQYSSFLPALGSSLWQIEPFSGAKFRVRLGDRNVVASTVSNLGRGAAAAASLVKAASVQSINVKSKFGKIITPPFRNPLIPYRLMPSRPLLARVVAGSSMSTNDLIASKKINFYYRSPVKVLERSQIGDISSNLASITFASMTTLVDESGYGMWKKLNVEQPMSVVNIDISGNPLATTRELVALARKRSSSFSMDSNKLSMMSVFDSGNGWEVYQPMPALFDSIVFEKPEAIEKPEASGTASLVIQIFSPRPISATPIQAARADLFLMSFNDVISDIANLGSASGIVYDIGYNEHGIRLAFQGMSQMLSKYVHAFCRKLADHSLVVTIDQKKMESSIINLSRMDSQRYTKWQIAQAIRDSSAQDVADEAKEFWLSCIGNGGVAIAQGDLLPTEGLEILNDVRKIFQLDVDMELSEEEENGKVTDRSRMIRPPLKALLYRPTWKPRMTSCFIPGIRLISDACGRVPR